MLTLRCAHRQRDLTFGSGQHGAKVERTGRDCERERAVGGDVIRRFRLRAVVGVDRHDDRLGRAEDAAELDADGDPPAVTGGNRTVARGEGRAVAAGGQLEGERLIAGVEQVEVAVEGLPRFAVAEAERVPRQHQLRPARDGEGADRAVPHNREQQQQRYRQQPTPNCGSKRALHDDRVIDERPASTNRSEVE